MVARRAQGAKKLESVTFPSIEEEIWRYSRIGSLSLDEFHLPGPPAAQLSKRVEEFLDLVPVHSGLVVTQNGSVTKLEADAKGLRIASAAEWGGEGLDQVAETSDYFSVLNSAFSADPILVEVAAGSVIEHPIVIVHDFDENLGVQFPRVLIKVADNAQATIIECFVSGDTKGLIVPVTEIDCSAGSNAKFVSVQLLGSENWQIATQASRLERDANLTSVAISLGGSYARVATESHLVGKGSSSKLKAVYFGTDSQMHDFRTLQGHEAPKSTSDLLFKGAVGNTAQSVYSGLIRIRKGAAGTNAFQTNRNLVLSKGAHADSVPNLEIDEMDVKCSHASAVGPVDEDHRYYLESRGVPTDVAERLIVLGFLDEVLGEISLKGLRGLLRSEVATKLDLMNEATQ